MPKETKGQKSVLIVEDNFTMSHLLVQALSHAFPKIRFITAQSVEEAMAVLRLERTLAVLITDLVLPTTEAMAARNRDGSGALVLIREANKTRPEVPIIVVTGFHHEGFSPARDLGIFDFVSKPVDVMEIVYRLGLAIKEHRYRVTHGPDRSSVVKDVHQVIMEEIERYAPIKERTLEIPGEGMYRIIKPLIGFKRDIERQIASFPFARNVFLMMKFRTTNNDIGDFIVETLDKHGLRGIRADKDEWNITKNVYNPIAVLYCCKFGLALFDEPEPHQAYSPNVAYELGIMHYQGKECLILRHAGLPAVPFDLIKDLYVTYNRDLQVRKPIEKWVGRIAAKSKEKGLYQVQADGEDAFA